MRYQFKHCPKNDGCLQRNYREMPEKKFSGQHTEQIEN